MTGDDFQIDDPEKLTLTLRAEEVAKHHARKFITDLLDDAGHHLRLNPGDYEGVIREVGRALFDAGFDPTPDEVDGDAIAWTFAGTEVFHDLEAELADVVNLAESPPVTVAGHLPVWHDPMLDGRTVVMLHRDAIVPTPPGIIERPWMVKDPDGVAVAEVGAP